MKALVSSARREINELLNLVSTRRMMSARQRDLIASYGERLSAKRAASVLKEICPALIPQATSGNSLLFVVDEKFVREVITRLHQTFFEGHEDEEA